MQNEQLNAFITDKVDDMKALDILTIDVQGKSTITDFMVICTGTSKRHVASIADHVASEATLAGMTLLAVDGESEGEWVIVDMGDTILHVMQQEQRDLYQLEKLWG